MFVDDTELDTAEKLNFSHILEANRNNDFNKMTQYLDYNRLSFNIPKCEFMLIDTHQGLTNMSKISVHSTETGLSS